MSEFLHNVLSRGRDLLPPVIRRYFIEIILITAAGTITVVSIVQHAYASVPQADRTEQVQDRSPEKKISPTRTPELPLLAVDVSGAVAHPGVYEASAGARIADMIKLAGGISYEADKLFVGRNFNMARLVGDQDKIYIPFTWDIALGTFIEEPRILEYLQPLYSKDSAPQTQSQILDTSSEVKTIRLSLNTATKQELDELPGVGPVTAQKIIDNRPYLTVEELISKKVLNQSTFDKLINFIDL